MQSFPKNRKTDPKEDFLENTTQVDFNCLLCPNMLKSLKKLFRVNPEMEACINLGHNWSKIAHLEKKVFGEISL